MTSSLLKINFRVPRTKVRYDFFRYMATKRPIKFLASGFKSPADDFAQHALDLNEFLIQHPASTFYMRNEGDRNQKHDILAGDILVVDRSIKPSSKYLNLIILDDEFRVNNYQELMKHKKMQDADLEFWGVIISVIRKF